MREPTLPQLRAQSRKLQEEMNKVASPYLCKIEQLASVIRAKEWESMLPLYKCANCHAPVYKDRDRIHGGTTLRSIYSHSGQCGFGEEFRPHVIEHLLETDKYVYEKDMQRSILLPPLWTKRRKLR